MISSQQAEIARLSQTIRPILHQYNIQKAILFGSYAKGNPSRHSDIDLILIQQTVRRFFERYDGIYLELSNVIGNCDLDVLIYTPDELNSMSDRPFISTVLQEGKVIYEYQQECL